MSNNIQSDVESISRISAIQTMLEVICRTTGMGFAAVARVTHDKWVACAVRDEIQFGLTPYSELKVETTICHEIHQSQKLVVIDNVSIDEIYHCHPTPAMYGFQSYISVPIILKNGDFFGTLCAIDPRPVHLNTPETIGMFQLYADLIAFHLHANEQLVLSEKKLQEERQTSNLREQFIAILGHDLRNPITAVSSSAKILQGMPLNEQGMRFVDIIQNSCYRMTGLIENILDFARGHLGEGITLNKTYNKSLEETFSQVIAELSIIYPHNVINTKFHLSAPVYCDSKRIAQLFSNLLTNALKYSKTNMPVTVQAISNNEEGFRLSVSNYADPIPATVMQRLFQPFSRGEVKPGQQGLGLGLYIASEIARAHGGIINATSTSEEITFSFQMFSNTGL